MLEKGILKLIIVGVMLSAFCHITCSQKANIPAFPGAEGGGMYATGGRGGNVYYVTKLIDDGSKGTFRWAIEQKGARTIIFKVSGTINLEKDLTIKNGNITIAGQTAPGSGICIAKYPVFIRCDNVIIRYIRFRLGDESQNPKVANSGDALTGGGTHKKNNRRDIIIDHCSMSWSMDECVSFYRVDNFTLQWCFITEALRKSYHPKGNHSYGAIWGGNNSSFHHNLLAHNDSRNPRFNGTRYGNGKDDVSTETVSFINNVIYNWGQNSGYAGEGNEIIPEGGHYNMIGNYYKYGPATRHKQRIFNPWKPYGKFYVKGNFVYASEEVSNDNWKGFEGDFTVEELEAMKLSQPVDITPITIQTAQEAYEDVLNYAGASLKRDAVDTRIVEEVRTQTTTYGGTSYKQDYGIAKSGIIDSQTDVGGYPALQSASAPLDSDNDGMPDSWEIANGLDPYDADDRNGYDLNHTYTNLEMYLNSLMR